MLLICSQPCHPVSYQVVMLGYIAVKTSKRNERDSKVWRKKAINNLGSHRRRAIGNRARSKGGSICSCRRRAGSHSSLGWRSTSWEKSIDGCTRRWDKGQVFVSMSFHVSFAVFFCSSSFKHRKKKKCFVFFFLISFNRKISWIAIQIFTFSTVEQIHQKLILNIH